MFSPAFCDFKVSLKSKNEDILNIENSFINPSGTGSKNASILDSLNSNTTNSAVFYAANATALKAGMAEIEVNFEINYDNSYYSQKISTIFRAKVADPISTHIPTYINGPEGRSDL